MSEKKIYLEELLDEIRTLSEHYETDEHDSDIFVLKPNETNAFAEDLFKIVKEFLGKDAEKDTDDDDIDSDDFDDDLFWLDDDIE